MVLAAIMHVTVGMLTHVRAGRQSPLGITYKLYTDAVVADLDRR